MRDTSCTYGHTRVCLTCRFRKTNHTLSRDRSSMRGGANADLCWPSAAVQYSIVQHISIDTRESTPPEMIQTQHKKHTWCTWCFISYSSTKWLIFQNMQSSSGIRWRVRRNGFKPEKNACCKMKYWLPPSDVPKCKQQVWNMRKGDSHT